MQLRRWALAWVTALSHELRRRGHRAVRMRCSSTGIVEAHLRGRMHGTVIRVWSAEQAIVELEVRGAWLYRGRAAIEVSSSMVGMMIWRARNELALRGRRP